MQCDWLRGRGAWESNLTAQSLDQQLAEALHNKFNR
jgi:hypothetical protein